MKAFFLLLEKADFVRLGGFALLLCLSLHCEYPYTPKRQPLPGSRSTDAMTAPVTAGSGVLHPVNPGQQTCNPSISHNPLYPGCMLWLGFVQLTVTVPESASGYDLSSISLHDRLTVVDTNNSVQWFILREAISPRGELQGPEWSTHPDFIACLLGTKTQPYDGLAIRLSDKGFLKFNRQKLEEFSTPHFWLPDTASGGDTVTTPFYEANGFIVKEQLARFFGTDRVKIAYTLLKESGTLYYLDYGASDKPVSVPLRKPAGRLSWRCASPLISPDGNWATYHCYTNPTQGRGYASFIQRLKPDAEPILIAEEASDPHWWVDPHTGDYNIIYTVTHGDYFTPHEFATSGVEKGQSAGATVKQRLRGAWVDGPAHIGGMAVDSENPPTLLVNLPFKGGLSRDGRFLCTAYQYAYIMTLR